MQDEDESVAKFREILIPTFKVTILDYASMEVRVGDKVVPTNIEAQVLLLLQDRLSLLSAIPALLASIFISSMDKFIAEALKSQTQDAGGASSFEDFLAEIMAETFNNLFPESLRKNPSKAGGESQFDLTDFKIIRPSDRNKKEGLELCLMVKQLSLYLINSILSRRKTVNEKESKSHFVKRWKNFTDMKSFSQIIKLFASHTDLMPVAMTETPAFDAVYALYAAEVFLTREDCNDKSLVKYEYLEEMANSARNLIDRYYPLACGFLKYYKPDPVESSDQPEEELTRSDYCVTPEKTAIKLLVQKAQIYYRDQTVDEEGLWKVYTDSVYVHQGIPLELIGFIPSFNNGCMRGLPCTLVRSLELIFEVWTYLRRLTLIPQAKKVIESLNKHRNKLSFATDSWRLLYQLEPIMETEQKTMLKGFLDKTDERLDMVLNTLKLIKKPTRMQYLLVMETLYLMVKSVNIPNLIHFKAIAICAIADALIEDKRLDEALELLNLAETRDDFHIKHVCPEYCIKKAQIQVKDKPSAARQLVEAALEMYSMRTIGPEVINGFNPSLRHIEAEGNWINVCIEDCNDSRRKEWKTLLNKQEIIKLLIQIAEQEIGKSKMIKAFFYVWSDNRITVEPEGFYPLMYRFYEEFKNCPPSDLSFSLRLQIIPALALLAEKSSSKTQCYLLMIFERLVAFCRELSAEYLTSDNRIADPHAACKLF